MGKLVIRQDQLPDYMDADFMMNSWTSKQTLAPKNKGCVICGDRITAADVCSQHFKDARTIPGFVQENGLTECLFDGCRMIRANYMVCFGHYAQLKRGAPLSPIKRPWGTDDEIALCMIPDCDRIALDYDAPLCKPHRRGVWKYGVTLEQLVALYANGSCQICGSSERLHIDHDHDCCPSLHESKGRGCGKCIRGLLCQGCNMALGSAKDNPQTLRALADYLESGARI